MGKAIDIRQKLRPGTIYSDLAKQLDPFKKRKVGAVTFLVDSSPNGKVKVFINYPGRKVLNRNIKKPRVNSVHWDCLYDFLVIPSFNGKKLDQKDLTYRKILVDFESHKKQSAPFWKAVLLVLENNKVPVQTFSTLKGINPVLFLYTLKWLWLQEDFNYRLNHNDFECPTRYRLPTGKSLGRKKFFASLLLVRTPYYTAKECFKLFS